MKALLTAVMSVVLIAGPALGIATADTDKRNDKKVERRHERDRDHAGAASPRTATRPAGKDACKNDGWRNFPHHNFKNQGDCISAVNRHEREQRKLQ